MRSTGGFRGTSGERLAERVAYFRPDQHAGCGAWCYPDEIKSARIDVKIARWRVAALAALRRTRRFRRATEPPRLPDGVCGTLGTLGPPRIGDSRSCLLRRSSGG